MERAALLLPLGYLVLTRARGARALAYIVITSMIPAVWLVIRAGQLDPGPALATFAAGYVAFMAIYEVGYLANDAWDAYRDPAGRKRLGFRPGPAFIAAFLAVRLAVWAALGLATGWLGDSIWLACYAAVVIVFALHNGLRAPALRVSTFLQLSVLRFVTPIIAALPAHRLGAVLVAVLLFYSYPRLLQYLDAKHMLAMPERKVPSVVLLQAGLLAPLALLAAFISGEDFIAELLVYWIAAYAGWGLVSRAGKGAASAGETA